MIIVNHVSKEFHPPSTSKFDHITELSQSTIGKNSVYYIKDITMNYLICREIVIFFIILETLQMCVTSLGYTSSLKCVVSIMDDVTLTVAEKKEKAKHCMTLVLVSYILMTFI